MAINKAMMAALKVLSYPDVDVKITYPAERKLNKIMAKAGKEPKNIIHEDRTIEYEGVRVPIRIFRKSAAACRGIFVFMHGGGWVSGSMESYSAVCANMADRLDKTVVSVDYRLAPENKFPCGLDDCFAAVCWTMQNRWLMCAADCPVTLIGDSAGGNLCAAVSLMLRDRGLPTPERQILIYPALYNDHTETSPFESVRTNGSDYLLTAKRVSGYMDMYASGPQDFFNPYFAPLLAEDLSDQPKTLIITAEFCPLRDEGEEYGRRLRAAGNYAEIFRLHDALHGFLSLPCRYKHVKQTYKLISRFLNRG